MVKKQVARDQKRIEIDPHFRMTKRLRHRIRNVVTKGYKSASTMELLGCTIEEFYKHIESLFQPGMTWDLIMKGKIHLDHIKACHHFDLTDPEQQKICFHYKNIQPLWPIDNLRKAAKENYFPKHINPFQQPIAA